MCVYSMKQVHDTEILHAIVEFERRIVELPYAMGVGIT
jgi:hypothetical protein